MAISANTVFEARAGAGNDGNGGGFVAGSSGTDFSQQNAAQLTLTDLATTGVVTTLTSATGGFTAAMVGNLIQIVSGTNFTAGFYQIVTFTNGNTVVLDRAPTTAAGSAGTGSVGGALATLGKLVSAMVASNKGYVTGAFTSTATITLAVGASPSGATGYTRIIGYGAARGDAGHATLTLATNTGLTGIAMTSVGCGVEQLDVDCASLGTSTGISVGNSDSYARRCKVSNFTTAGITVAAPRSVVADCEATGGGAAATAGINHTSNIGLATRCFVHDNACKGIVCLAGYDLADNLIVNNSGASSDGVQAQTGTVVINNTIHNNGRDGIRNSGATYGGILWINNLLTNNAGFGLTGSNGVAIPAGPDYDGNAYFGNGSGNRNLIDSTAGLYGVTPYTNVHDVILTASPYVGPTTGASANFNLNSTAGGGAACRGAGQPGPFPGNSGTTAAGDIGAAQHADSGGAHFIG
jgi:hypothetical protein